MKKIICLVYEDKEEINIKKLITLPNKSLENNHTLESLVYDKENQIWYKISVEKC